MFIERTRGYSFYFRTTVSVLAVIFSLAFIEAAAVSCKQAQPNTQSQARALEELRAALQSGVASDAALRAIEIKYPRTQGAGLARFLRGYIQFKNSNFAESAAILNDTAISQTTALGDYALFYHARALEELQRYGEAQRAYEALIKKFSDSIMTRDAILKVGEVALKNGDYKKTITYLSRAAAQLSPAALKLTAQAQAASGDLQSAIATYKKLYFETPASIESEWAAARLKSLGISIDTAQGVSYEQLRGRADRLFEADQHASAATAYEQVLKLYPGEIKDSDNFNLRRGISLYLSGEKLKAIEPLRAVTSADPQLHSQSLFYLAESYRYSKQTAQFVSTGNQLRRLYPRSKWAVDSLYNTAVYYEKSGRQSEASDYYNQLLNNYPESEKAVEASFFLAWRAHQAKNYREAARLLTEYVANYPDSDYKAKAAFWAARDEERTNQPQRALALYQGLIERYRYGYYGQVAANRIELIKKANPNLKPLIPEPASALARAVNNLRLSPAPIETPSATIDLRLTRAQQLKMIRLTDFALEELRAASNESPSSPRVNLETALIFSERGDNLLAINTLRRAYPDYPYYRDEDLPREVWQILFPLREWNLIKSESEKYGLDPYFVAGLIRQESVFDPNARSRANARGLMQILPSTGKLVARKQGLGSVSAEDLYDPVISIKLGTQYLASLVDKFGRIEYAAAAYNGGPGRVVRWLRERPEQEIEEWIENIPITETRLYVQGVLRNAANYRRFYGAMLK